MKLISVTIKSDIVIINLKGRSLINHCHDDDQPFQDDRACGAESAGGCSDCRTQPRIWISPRSPRKKVFAALTKSIYSTYKKGFAVLTKKYWRHIQKHYTPSQSFGT